MLAAGIEPQGEEAIAAAAHLALEPARSGLLTIVAPRHPARGPTVAAVLARAGLRAVLRSDGAALTSDVAAYVADTLGELGLWYRLADIAVVGGSLVPHGGHNPLEPAMLHRPILLGPYMENFGALTEELVTASGARATDAERLARDLEALLADPGARESLAAAAAEFAAAEAGAAAAIADRLLSWFPRPPRM